MGTPGRAEANDQARPGVRGGAAQVAYDEVVLQHPSRILGALSFVLCLLAVSCLEPTQIEVTLRTDVAWAEGRTVAVSVGKTSALEQAEPSTVAEQSWPQSGQIGTLVLLPSDDRDEPVSVRVVMGLGRDPSTCTLEDAKGCIIARRRLSFVPHSPLALPIALYAACEGIPCDANTTCTALGTCVSSELDPEQCADGRVCEPGAGEADATSTSGGPATDAAAPNDARVTSDAAQEGGSSGDAADGSAPPDAGSADAGPRVCSSDVLSLAAGDVPTWGTFVDEGAQVTIDTLFNISVGVDGQGAYYVRSVPVAAGECPVHVELNTADLNIGNTGAKVNVITVDRAAPLGILTLEATKLANGARRFSVQGSAMFYDWPVGEVGIVELVVPLTAGDGPVRLVVDAVETALTGIPEPAQSVPQVKLGLGLKGSKSAASYKSVRYHFGL